MKSWFAPGVAAWLLAAGVPAQTPEVALTRPGQIIVSAVTGEVALASAGQVRPAKVDDRVRVDARVTTGRRSLVTLAFSNGAVLELGPESELAVEELLQAPFVSVAKSETWSEEPSVSKTRVRLVRGDGRLAVKPLKVTKGSEFVVAMPAGNVRVTDGSLYTLVRMTDAGIGLCVIELARGRAELEAAGGAPAAQLTTGQRYEFAVEIVPQTGAVKIGPMPSAAPPAKK